MLITTQEQRQKLRQKSTKELALFIGENKSNVSDVTLNSSAHLLKLALRKDVFVVVTDKSKTLAEMAEELHFTELTVKQLRSVLIAIGVEKRREKKPIASLHEEVLPLIEKIGPCTIKVLAEEMCIRQSTANKYARTLKREGKVEMFSLSWRERGSFKHGFYDLLDSKKIRAAEHLITIAGDKTQQRRVAGMILDAIKTNRPDGLTLGERKSLTQHLHRSDIPKPIFQMVRESLGQLSPAA